MSRGSAIIAVFMFVALLAAGTPASASAAAASVALAGTDQMPKARTVRATDLRDHPASEGKLLEVVPANSDLLVRERRGGWYHVVRGEQDGWVRLTAVRFATTTPSSSGGITAPLAFLRSGRSAVQTGTVTTGVRGLSEVDLANATPNPSAVSALDPHAVTPEDARAFAARIGLVATAVEFVKVHKKDKDHKGKDDDGDGGG